MTIDVLTLTPADLSAALRLSTQAGWNQIEADWIRLLRLWPHTCFAGRVNGALVATATLATFGGQLGWVGMVLVDEAHRGRGYGGAILDAAIDAGRRLGLKTIGLDATDLGRPVYFKRGFVDFAGIDRWVREPASGVGALGAARGRMLTTNDHLADLIAFDEQAARIDRAALLQELAAEPGVRACTAGRESRVCGYGILRPGRTAMHMGPVTAETESDAIAVIEKLISSCSTPCDMRLFIDVPRGRLQGGLASAGFAVARKLTRMLIGPGDAGLMGPNVYAAVGFELG